MTLGRLTVIAVVALILVAPAHTHGVSEEVDRIAGLMELRPGMQLAEVGAGDGTFAEALARRVGPTGHVFINEINDGELLKIRRRIKRSDLTNMSLVEGEVKDTQLPDDCCDGILLRYVYHHMSEPEAIFEKLNQLLAEAGFDRFVEELCQTYYHATMGRPGIPPGTYFRMLLVGYFEGIGSQRGIAWR